MTSSPADPSNISTSMEAGNRAVIVLFSGVKDALKFPPAQNGAVIDLANVVSFLHLESALYKVLFNLEKRGFSSSNIGAIPSNICYALSSSKKTSETQKRYLPSISTKNAAYLLINPTDEYLESIRNTIAEQELGVEENSTSFVSSLLSAEKATELAALFKLSPHELKIGSLEEAIIMKVAVKESV